MKKRIFCILILLFSLFSPPINAFAYTAEYIYESSSNCTGTFEFTDKAGNTYTVESYPAGTRFHSGVGVYQDMCIWRLDKNYKFDKFDCLYLIDGDYYFTLPDDGCIYYISSNSTLIDFPAVNVFVSSATCSAEVNAPAPEYSIYPVSNFDLFPDLSTCFFGAYAEEAIPVYAPGQDITHLIPLNVKSTSDFNTFDYTSNPERHVSTPFYKAVYNETTGTLTNMIPFALVPHYDSQGFPSTPVESLVKAADNIDGNAIVFIGSPCAFDRINERSKSYLYLIQVDGQRPVAPAPMPFTDLTEGETFYEDIQWVYSACLMNGKSDASFDRKGNVSRQQVWRILSRAIEGEDVGSMANAKTWAINHGISDGTRPGEYATREEMVTMMWLAFGQPYAEGTNVLADFPDAASVSADSKAAMEWAVENGIISGTKAGTLNPAGTLTRGAFAAIMHRYLGK